MNQCMYMHEQMQTKKRVESPIVKEASSHTSVASAMAIAWTLTTKEMYSCQTAAKAAVDLTETSPDREGQRLALSAPT